MNFKAHIVSEDELYSVTLLTNSFDYRCPSFVFRGAFRGDKETRANFEGLSRAGIVRLIASVVLSAEGASRHGLLGCGWGASGGCLLFVGIISKGGGL